MPKSPRPTDTDESTSRLEPALERTDVLPPTAMIGGKYKLGKLLGEGGMGAVYEAEHMGLGVKVAVKLLNEMFTADPNAVSRFRREARAAAAIRHPNIVEVTDTGTDDDGIPFIVMELLEGESLSALLRRERVLSPTLAALITGQILAGLAAAHEKGIIHRDLKPGNILLARKEDGTFLVKILDFGISKFFDGTSSFDVTALGAVIGTPRFMAPEQAKGQSDLDGRVDIYAAGVLLYRMVTGRLPFGEQKQEEVIRAILEGRITPPRKIRPDLSAELEAIILKTMATRREERYASARELLAALQQIVPEVTLGTSVLISTQTTLSSTPSFLSAPISGTSFAPTAPTDSFGDRSTRPASPHALAEIRSRQHRLVLPLLLILVLGASLAGYLLLRRSRAPGASSSKSIATSAPPLRFGITRYLPEGQMASEHQALKKYLSQRLQRPVELKIYDDYIDLSAQLAEGKLDLAALTAYAYVRSKRVWPGLMLLATHVTTGGTSYEGYIVAKANNNIESLADLEGKVFCYVGPNSTSGFLYPRAVLRRQGMDPDTSFKSTRFTGDHLSSLRALENGACDGAAVFAGIFFEAKKHGLTPQKYTILATTPRIPYDAYCVAPRISPGLIRSLRDALLALSQGLELAKGVLGAESRIVGFAPARDEDYDSVRRIEKFLDAPAHAKGLKR